MSRDWFVSFSSDFCAFVRRSFAFVLRYYKSRCADSLVLEYLLYSKKISRIFVPTSFLPWSRVGMIFQCNCVILNDLFLSPPTSDKDLRYLSSSCHHSRMVLYNHHFLCLRAFLGISCALWYIVRRTDGPCLVPWIGFFLTT